MRWIEVSLDTPAEEIDRRCDELAALGASGFVIENEADFQSFLEHNHQYWDYVDEALASRFRGVSRIKCYLPDEDAGWDLLQRIRALYEGVSVSYIADSDWENNWRDYYKPIEVGEKLVVVPEWEDAPEDGRLPLRLDPGLIFGTGSHATTRMCLSALESLVTPGMRVLDLGCGSGILGIGALLFGADSCLGCDVDPKEPDVAAANAALNGFGPERFRVLAGDILADAGLRRELGTGYGLVLANIVADVILPLAAFARSFMAEGAAFVCSGIIEGRQDELRAALLKHGFTIERHLCEEEWHCFVCR